jgi:hypothetical protein
MSSTLKLAMLKIGTATISLHQNHGRKSGSGQAGFYFLENRDSA